MNPTVNLALLTNRTGKLEALSEAFGFIEGFKVVYTTTKTPTKHIFGEMLKNRPNIIFIIVENLTDKHDRPGYFLHELEPFFFPKLKKELRLRRLTDVKVVIQTDFKRDYPLIQKVFEDGINVINASPTTEDLARIFLRVKGGERLFIPSGIELDTYRRGKER